MTKKLLTLSTIFLVLLGYSKFSFSQSIPPIYKSEKVVDWFLQNDSKIKDYSRNYPDKLKKLKADILAEIEANSNGPALKEHVKNIGSEYEKALINIANKYDSTNWHSAFKASVEAGESHKDYSLFHFEAYLAAKMRILGYFLLKKYGIQPE